MSLNDFFVSTRSILAWRGCEQDDHYQWICRIGAEGKICLIEAESIAAVQAIRAYGLKCYTTHLSPASEEHLQSLVLSEIGSEPPIGYTAQEAVEQFLGVVRSELALANANPGLWDANIRLSDQAESSYYMMMEAVADKFQDIVPPCHVWGFGSQLWDKSKRHHGSRPLNMMLLGPVAAGKTTIALRLAQRFGMKHINAGTLPTRCTLLLHCCFYVDPFLLRIMSPY